MSRGGRHLATLALLLYAAPAGAKEVWRDGRGGVLEVQGFAKSFLTGVWLQPSLVEGTAALQARLDEVRRLLPPKSAALLPTGVALPGSAALDAHLGRVAAKFRFEDRVQLEAAWQVALTLSSDPAFTGGASLTNTIGGAGTAASAQRRLVALGSTVVEQPGLRVAQDLDRLALTLALPFGDLTVGRQVLSWGTGRLWNPTDVLSPFPPTVVDREVRRGFDAVRLAVALGDTTQLDLLYLPQPAAEDSGGVARLQANLLGWDGSVSAGKYARDVVLGADLVGDVGPLGVHAEGAYTLGLVGLGAGTPVRVDEHFFRGVVGVDWRPTEELLLLGEYHFNGFGAEQASGYAERLTSARAARGEVFNAGRHYAGLVASWQFDELVSGALTALVNLTDPSAMLVPTVEWWFEQTVIVRAGASLPLGASPDAGAFTGLTAADVLGQSAAFARATRTLGLRSEYGSSAWSVFLQVGLYVP